MKKILSLTLVMLLSLGTLLLTSCLDRKPSNDLELLWESYANTTAAFAQGSKTADLPDLTGGAAISMKADLMTPAGISFDADITLAGTTVENAFVAINLNKLSVADVLDLGNISAYVSADKLAASIGDVSSSYVGLEYANLEKVIEHFAGAALDEVTKAEIQAFKDALELYKNELNNAVNTEPAEAPEFTDEHTAYLYTLLTEKGALTSAENGSVTEITLNLNSKTAIEILKSMITELRKDDKWNSLFTDLENELSAVFEDYELEITAKTVNEMIDELLASLEESEFDPEDLSILCLYKIEKVKSVNKNCVTYEKCEIKYQDEVAADVSVTYTLAENALAVADIKLYDLEADGEELLQINLTFEKAAPNGTVNEYKLNGRIDSDDDDDAEFALTYKTDSNDGSYEIALSLKDSETDETISVGGTYTSSKESTSLTVNAIGIKSIGITIDPKLEITVKPADGVSFPDYTEITSLSENEIIAYLTYIQTLFGSMGESEEMPVY